MSDGLRVPAAHDGMAAFPAPDDKIVLITNHELKAGFIGTGPFDGNYNQLDESIKACLYDRGADKTPGIGGTTTTLFNPATGSTEKQFLSLAGTELNCAGGRLRALAISGRPSQATHNWDGNDIRAGEAMRVHWIDLDNVDSDNNDLRLRGAVAGAATFARGDGLTVAGDRIAFTCTTGGFERLGQVYSYRPSPFERTAREAQSPAELTLIAEADATSLLKNCDNLTMAPWGDLILCGDAVGVKGQCGLIGIRANGSQYAIANNADSDSELAGVCFSPDGKTLFLNIQIPGITLAITGPWPS
jgi:secreted PhoX family phosphatase